MIEDFEPYKNLANAIIAKTCDDWWESKNKIEKLEKKLSGELDEEKRKKAEADLRVWKGRELECEQFFKSAWGDFISRHLADVIFERLQALYVEYKGDVRKYRKQRKTATYAHGEDESGIKHAHYVSARCKLGL